MLSVFLPVLSSSLGSGSEPSWHAPSIIEKHVECRAETVLEPIWTIQSPQRFACHKLELHRRDLMQSVPTRALLFLSLSEPLNPNDLHFVVFRL